LRGANDIAVGSVVGSNIANIGLILGAITLLRPSVVHKKLLRIDVPLMILASLVLIVILDDGQISRSNGVAFLIGLVGFIYATFSHARRRPEQYPLELVATPSQEKVSTAWPVMLIASGCIALAAGGHIVVGAAVNIALMANISQAAIALTVVAVGTSLPEFAASLVAAARGHSDLAVGNIVGSNIFNILGILGVTSMVTPLARGGINWSILLCMTGMAILFYLLVRKKKALSRLHGGLLLLTYIAYLVYVAG
jgi:cation:H+ antiporter